MGGNLRAVDDWQTSIGDPASVLVGLGAICALFAAVQWWRAGDLIAAATAGGSGARARALFTNAATLTSIAMALAASGYLFGRFTGRF